MSRRSSPALILLVLGSAACSEGGLRGPRSPAGGRDATSTGVLPADGAADSSTDGGPGDGGPTGAVFVDGPYAFSGDGAAGARGDAAAGGGTGGSGGATGARDGGPPGTGGSAGSPGAFDAGAPSWDGAAFPDAAADRMPGPLPDAGAADAGAPPPDGPRPRPCTVEVRPMSAGSLSRLVPGPRATAIVGATVLNVADPGDLRWSWQVVFRPTNTSVPVAPDPSDPAVVLFRVERPGEYTITASTTVGGAGCSSGPVEAQAVDSGVLKRNLVLLAVPPRSAHLPIQYARITVDGGVGVWLPWRLQIGTDLTIDPRDQGTRDTIVSYVRVVDLSAPVTLEGYADQQAGFGALLAPGLYQVLVIPTGAGGQGVATARHAPFVIESGTPESLAAFPFLLSSGVAVAGRIADSRGAVVDARVVLRAAVPSTVGRSGSDGTYQVLARSGAFAVTISPPPGSGLPEAQVLAGPDGSPPVAITEGSPGPTIDFAWDAIDAAELSVRVVDGQDRVMPQTRVRVQAPLARAGTLTVRAAGGGAPATLEAAGNIRLDGETDGTGVVRFGRVPRAPYAVLVVPGAGAGGAITSATVSHVQAGTYTVRLGRMARILGALTGPAGSALGGVRIVATDVGMDLATSPVVAETAADGSFALPVSPRRRYLVLAHPPAGSGFARTFVGSGPIEASELPLRQVLPPRLVVDGQLVSDQNRYGIPGVVIKVFCDRGSSDCPDPAVPLAEAVTGAEGRFQLGVADPLGR